MYSLAPANFDDYREFLLDRFEQIRSSHRHFSITACAKKAKISKSLLQFVFKKERHLSLDRFPLVAKALKLDTEEESFVYLSICKAASKNPQVQVHFEAILSRLRHQYVNHSSPSEPQLSTTNNKALYLDFLFMLIQSMTRLQTFKEDPEWILQQIIAPDVTLERVQQAMQELQNLGFLIRNQDGQLEPRELTLWRPDPYDPKGQDVFKKGAEAMAQLMQRPELYKPSVYMSMSLTFDEETLKKAEQFMIEVHHKLCELSKTSKNPTAVVQIANFMLTVVRLSHRF